MSQHSDRDQPSIDDQILRDVGRWAPERDAIKATCRNEDDESDDTLSPMSAEHAEQLVEELLSLRRQSPPPSLSSARPQIFAQRELEDPEPSELDTEPTMERLRAVPSTRPDPDGSRSPLPWRLIASHGGVALAAALATLWVCKRINPTTMHAVGGLYQIAQFRGTDAPTHLGAGDEGYCLDKEAQVHITGQSATTEEIEIVLEATPESGSAHWFLHSPITNGWRIEPDESSLFFQGPLRDLALLDPGAWTLTFQVGPRGSCGPNASPRCATLSAESIHVAPSSQC